jgi:hypothetical protein
MFDILHIRDNMISELTFNKRFNYIKFALRCGAFERSKWFINLVINGEKENGKI